MSGRLDIVGLGPGAADLLTPRAEAVLAGATDLVGYHAYLARVPMLDRRPGRADQQRHGSDNRDELARARHALALAQEGRQVAVVSGGDAGVFGMAAAVFEAIETGDPAWRTLEVAVVPGVSAVLAAAARIGAPLGHDFCVLSLSDNLKPWEVIASRLRAAATAGFVIVLYNPQSRARPWQLAAALELLGSLLPGTVPVLFATAVEREDERIVLSTLATADAACADMRTLVLIGTAETRRITREGRADWIYSPRGSAR